MLAHILIASHPAQRRCSSSAAATAGLCARCSSPRSSSRSCSATLTMYAASLAPTVSPLIRFP
ncbi:hypothetical protein K439DRAFT_1563304 [Ramaria rubella]|nr:hypothetical protein K439DRAFT_1510543 [Ramaria rubella]KAF8585149.1 hypothetical protein K439DRAFT_1563304 [Ramaria rubella]